MAIGKKIALGNGFNLCDSEDFYPFDLAGVIIVVYVESIMFKLK